MKIPKLSHNCICSLLPRQARFSAALIKKSSRVHFADSTVLLGMGSVNNQQYSNAGHCWFKTPPHPTISVPTTAPSLLFALRLILAPEMPFLFLSRTCDLCVVNCADSNGQMFGFPPTGWNISVFTQALIWFTTFNWIWTQINNGVSVPLALSWGSYHTDQLMNIFAGCGSAIIH